MTLPVATLDHVFINARDDLDHAADIYRRLGFTLTQRGYHSMGSMNHLAMFGTDFLELIAVPKGATIRRDLLDYPSDSWDSPSAPKIQRSPTMHFPRSVCPLSRLSNSRVGEG